MYMNICIILTCFAFLSSSFRMVLMSCLAPSGASSIIMYFSRRHPFLSVELIPDCAS